MRLTLPLLLLFSSTVGAQAPNPVPGKCKIEGRVVKMSGGAPIRDARVMLFTLDGRKTLDTRTDADGKFAFTDIDPGQYTLNVERTGFVPQEYREASGNHPNRVLTLEAGQKREDIVVRLVATGVITGRVFNSQGEGQIHVYVAAVIVGKERGKSIAYVQSSDTTDDQGSFRMHSLRPGRYVVRASPADLDDQESLRRNTSRASSQGAERQAPTYHPGTTEIDRAIPVDVGPGSEVKIDLTLQTAPMFFVRGRVQRPLGAKPALGTQLWLMPLAFDFEPGASHVASIDGPNGEFEIAGVRAGTYFLTAVISHDERKYLARQTVEVQGYDLEGIFLVPVPGAEIQGRVRADGGASLKPKTLRAGLGPKNELHTGLSEFADVREDGTFVLKDVVDGEYYAALLGLPEDLYLRAVRAGRVDAKGGLTVAAGSVPGSLEFIVSKAQGTVEGVVLDESGQPVQGAYVVLWDEATGGREGLFYRQRQADASGHFRFDTVPPGTYSLLAAENVKDFSEDPDPEAVERLKEQKNKVELGEAEKKVVEVRILSIQRPKQ